MEELGDGFSFVFVVFLDVVWPMSLELDVVTGSFVGYL